MCPLSARFRRKRTHKRREEASSPFHKTLLSSKTCGLLHHANLEIRATQCQLPSVVKDRSFRSTASDRNVSAPGGAQCRFGANPAITSEQQKTRRRAPGESVLLPSRYIRATLERMCSKLDFVLPGIRNQPHLWMSRQARSVSRLPPESGLHQLQSSITQSKFPSSCIQDSFTFSRVFCLWISPASVEIV